MKKKLTIKSKVELSKFLYNEDIHLDGLRSNTLESKIVDLTDNPESNDTSYTITKPISRNKNNKRTKKLLTLRKNGNTVTNSQPDVKRVYTKENLDDYRSQFQLSYDKLSQKYYDALDSPSKIPDIFASSSDDEIVYDDKECLKQDDIFDGNDSLMSDDIVLPSQQDVEVVVYKKKKKLFNELYYTDLKPSNDIDNENKRKKTSVIPMSLSQVFEDSSVEEIDLAGSNICSQDDIVVDSDIATSKRSLQNTELLIISSDDEPFVVQSQFDSPTKYNLEVLPSNDPKENKMSLTEINSIMADQGIIFNNKELISIATTDTDVRQFLMNKSTKLDEQILTNLSEQKNMSILKYELFEIFQKGNPISFYDNIFRSIKEMVHSAALSKSEDSEFVQVIMGLSTGKAFNLDYFTTIIFSKLCERNNIDSMEYKALSKLIQRKHLKSLYENRLGANFEMDMKKK